MVSKRFDLHFERIAFTISATGKRVDITRQLGESQEDFAKRLGDAVREAEKQDTPELPGERTVREMDELEAWYRAHPRSRPERGR